MSNLFFREISETMQNLPAYVSFACAAGVGVCTIGAGTCWLAKKVARSARQIAAVSLVGAVLIGGMVVVGTDDAGTKTGTNDVTQVEGGTNQTENGEWRMENAGGTASTLHSPFSILHLNSLGLRLGSPPPTVSLVSDEDISNQWRVVLVSSNAFAVSTFTMPEGATVWEDARDFGAGWGSWKIPLDGWRFTYGDEGWTNAFAWVEGYFRSKFRSRANEIRLLSERLALCPAAHWSRYNLAASRAWSATNDVDGLVVTFENAAIGDDSTKIASVQMELFPRTGEVALRYDLANVGDATYTAGLVVDGTNHFVTVGAGTREVVFQHVHPYDWDMDGLPNSIDDNPRVPSPNTGYNQTGAWAMAAFPSNSAEIASVGYAAWAAARAAEPNRHLIGLQVSSPENVWPICLTFGDKQVMCDGTEMLYFAIDDGARYSFELSDGALAAVDFDGSEMLGGLPVEWYSPWEYQSWPSMVTLHVDSARSGWIGRTAEVSVDGLNDSHFFPNGSETVTAVVTNCHEDAYLDCTWIGGEGISFSDNHSLSTTIYWNSTNGVAWATNYVDLVTTYEGGYAITNHHGITVGGSDVPPLRLSMTGQDVYFLNDYNNGNRTERVYRVSFELQGPRGTTGNLSVDSIGGAEMKFFMDGNILQPATNSIRLAIGEDDYFCSTNLYLACPELGRGIVSASFAADGAGAVSTSRTCRVIEPLRRFVTNETYPNSRQYVNPSCLVHGTNAILKVDVRTGYGTGAGFGPGEVKWKWISGPCTIQSNGWYAVVTPTATNGEVEIETRFNEDEIQPRFKLPIVCQKIVGIHAFIVEAPERYADKSWSVRDVRDRVDFANDVFGQVGIQFRLLSVTNALAGPEDWIVRDRDKVYEGEKTNLVLSAQCRRLFADNHHEDGIDVLFVGGIEGYTVSGFTHGRNIVLGEHEGLRSLAHELGHVFSLKDCYDRFKTNGVVHIIYEGDCPLFPGHFDGGGQDWGAETRRGFYGLEDDLSSVLQKLLMFGFTEEDGVDIPQFRVTGLKKNAIHEFQDEKSKVGARFIDFHNLTGLTPEEK